jgi:hypothetical protein
VQDDDPHDYSHHPTRRRATRELVRWEKHHHYSFKSRGMYSSLGEKPPGLGSLNDRNNPEDGIYCQAETELKIPATGSFCPTSPKFAYPPDDHICKHNKRPPLARIFHSVKLQIDLINAEPITIDSGCYLLSVGRKEILKVLDTDPEIMPPLDYERVVGLEVWVPTYNETDPLLISPSTASFSTSEESDFDDMDTEPSSMVPCYDEAISQPIEFSKDDPLFKTHQSIDMSVSLSNRSVLQLISSGRESARHVLPIDDESSPTASVSALLMEAMETSIV